MRDSLRDHLFHEISAGRVARLARIGLRAAAAHGGLPLPRKLRGPLLATFALTYRCPLLCEMCDLPLRASGEIADADVPRWIDAIAALGPAGLGFTGGEPLVRRVALDAIERSVSHGIVTHLNTSGLPVTDGVAARLARSGLASINVSVDHADAEFHDRVRRRRGAHDAALAAVIRLARARDAAGLAFRLQVVMVVAGRSLPEVPRLERLVKDAGADALSLLPVHDFDQGETTSSDASIPRDVDACLPPTLENSRRYLAGIEPFLRGAETPTACSAPDTAVFIDPTGRLFACTPGATEGTPGILATPETLSEIVKSGRLAETVPAARCRRCWWNCHRELDVALGRL